MALMNQDGVSTDEARALYSSVREQLKANAKVAPPHVITPPCLTPCTAAVPDQLWRHAPSAPRPTPGRLSLLRSSIAASTLPGRFAILSSQHGIKADHSSHFTLAHLSRTSAGLRCSALRCHVPSDPHSV